MSASSTPDLFRERTRKPGRAAKLLDMVMLVLVGLLVQAILAFRNARPRYMGWVSMHVRRR